MKNYSPYRLEHLVEIRRVITIHHFEFDKHFHTQGESHDFWELVYADKEAIVCTADGKEITLQPGQMLFHKPNEFHTLAANGKKAPTVLIVSFECKSEAMRFFEGRRVNIDHSDARYLYAIVDVAKKTFDIPYSDPNLKKLVLLPEPTLGGQQLIKNYLEILLINIMRSLTQTQSPKLLKTVEPENPLVQEILTVLRENVTESLTIDDICHRISYGRAYAFRVFKKETGQSIMACFTGMKIDRAKQLLRENELSIAQIAEALSFDTPGYFSKTFKRITGQTPSAYQKMNRKL